MLKCSSFLAVLLAAAPLMGQAAAPNPLLPGMQLATTVPATAWVANPTAEPDDSRIGHTGLVEFFAKRLAPYEPIYFIVGTDRPNAKFQFSLRYQLFDDQGSLAGAFPPIAGLSFAYSQTSFWDLEGESKPFVDNSYRPEVLLHYDDIVDPRRLGGVLSHIGLQTGIQHESNGQAGETSRNINNLYVRPIFTFGSRAEREFFVTVAPRAHIYIANDSHNSDIREYRGYFDLRLVIGEGGGLQAAFVGRLGSAWDKGSIQMDLTYPLPRLIADGPDLYLTAQVFNGFGEGLVGYNESDTTFRIGVSLIR